MNWRQRLQLLQGCAGDTGQGQRSALSADVDIVAYNFGRNVTAIDVRNWLGQKGLHVKDCKLLTTSSEARTLTYKITIKPEDFDRATNDATVWPYRVGVRLFKSFNNRNQTQRNIGNIEGGRDRNRDSRRGYYMGVPQGWRESSKYF